MRISHVVIIHIVDSEFWLTLLVIKCIYIFPSGWKYASTSVIFQYQISTRRKEDILIQSWREKWTKSATCLHIIKALIASCLLQSSWLLLMGPLSLDFSLFMRQCHLYATDWLHFCWCTMGWRFTVFLVHVTKPKVRKCPCL